MTSLQSWSRTDGRPIFLVAEGKTLEQLHSEGKLWVSTLEEDEGKVFWFVKSILVFPPKPTFDQEHVMITHLDDRFVVVPFRHFDESKK